MAYRAPFFCFMHAMRDQGASECGSDPAADSSYPLIRLLDNHTGTVFKHDSAQADSYIWVDLQDATPDPAPNRFVLAAGHNLGGLTWLVQQDTGSGFASPTSRGGSTVPAGTGVYSSDFAAVTERYLRFKITESVQGEYREFMFGRTRTPIAGPSPDWTDEYRPNLLEIPMRSGSVYRLELGDAKRHIGITFPAVESADLVIFEDLETQTRHGLYPFYFFPPDDGEDPIFVQLTRPISRRQASRNPQGTGQWFDVTLSMLEVLP